MMQNHFTARFSVIFFVALTTMATVKYVGAAMTMKQIEQSMEMFRTKCAQKTSVELDLVKGLHRGEFVDVKELKCFTHCIAQMAGTLSKKGELIESKVRQQIDTLLPTHLRELAHKTLDACKDVQHKYKDACDKSFYMTKCMYEFSPADFMYP